MEYGLVVATISLAMVAACSMVAHGEGGLFGKAVAALKIG